MDLALYSLRDPLLGVMAGYLRSRDAMSLSLANKAWLHALASRREDIMRELVNALDEWLDEMRCEKAKPWDALLLLGGEDAVSACEDITYDIDMHNRGESKAAYDALAEGIIAGTCGKAILDNIVLPMLREMQSVHLVNAQASHSLLTRMRSTLHLPDSLINALLSLLPEGIAYDLVLWESSLQ